MASKSVYSVVAVAGIALASAAAWWYQNQPPSPKAPTEGVSPAVSPAQSPGAGGPNRPVAVEAAAVQALRLTDDAQSVGSLRSRQSVVLRPEVGGRITQILFRDGERVRKGQLLVQLDDQLPRAQVQQSQAELSIAQANHKRNQELVAQNFISQRSLDESAANLEVAQAKLALAQATVARLRIVAPFDGVAGIRLVNVGDYLKDGADIVNIEDLDAVYVDFRLPERYQTRLRKGQLAEVALDALPGRRFSALVQAIDPLVDANGRSIGVRGCIDNRELVLRPGMFARVNTVFGVRESARVIPEEAVVPQGNRLFVLKVVPGEKADSFITQRVEVKLGLRRAGLVEVTDGLELNDRVVTAGQQRVQKDGAAVRVVESAKPATAAKAEGAAAATAQVPVAARAAAVSGRNPCQTGAAPAGQPA